MWNERSGDKLMKTYYPHYYNTYKNVKYPIMKIDILRYCILQQFCGMYADIDYNCFANFYKYILNSNKEIHLNEQPNQTYNNLFGKSVSNSLIISTKKFHPFWNVLIKECFNRIHSYPKFYHIFYVVKTTGPGLINDMLHTIKKTNNRLFKTINLLPFNQFNFCNDCNKCYPSKTKKLYAVHDYVSYWNSDFWLNFRKMFSCYSFKDIIPILLILLILLFFYIINLRSQLIY